MQIRTTSDMKIRKASGSKISKGGTVLKFGEEMIFGTSRRASGGINSLNASFYPVCRKTPCFSYGDIRHFHRIYASN